MHSFRARFRRILLSKPRFTFTAVAAVVLALVAAGCGSSSSSTSGAASNAASSGSAGSADTAVVTAAKAAVAKLQAPEKQWTGPTSGPPAQKGKSIAYISCDQTNTACKQWGTSVQAAAKLLGWHATVFDGQGTTNGYINAMNQAIAQGVNGIILSASPDGISAPIKAAKARGIRLIGMQSGPGPGPQPSLGLYWNVAQSPTDIAHAIANEAIADSDGKAKVVILTDQLYAVAREKAAEIKADIQKCSGCKLLAFENSPLANVTTDISPLVSSLVSKYGQNFYILAIADAYFDYVAPALRSDHVGQTVKLIASDGTTAAYDRVRTGNYEIATVPLGYALEAYDAVDEMNRAFAGAKPSTYIPPVHLVTKANIGTEGGPQDTWTPSNGFQQHFCSIWKVSC